MKTPDLKDSSLLPPLQSGFGQTSPKEKLMSRDPFQEDQLKGEIRKMGIKVTNQRMAILRSLSQGRAHVTAQEVFEEVHKTHSEIGFATVYRFLRKLAEHHLVTEVRMGGLPARYELTPKGHHDHLTCTECGLIVEFHNDQIENLQTEVARGYGFDLQHHVLELYGVCPRCRAQRGEC